MEELFLLLTVCCTVHKINSFELGNSARKRFNGNNFCFPDDHARST